LNLLRGFATLAALLLFSVAAKAQAVPGASSTIALDVFLGTTGISTGLGSGRNAGLTAGATLGFHPFFHLTPALEVRGTLPIDQGSVDGQKNVLGGLQVATQLSRFHPYANILFGRGEITYLNGGIRFLVSSSSTPSPTTTYFRPAPVLISRFPPFGRSNSTTNTSATPPPSCSPATLMRMPLPLGSNITWPDVIASRIPENFSAADEPLYAVRDGSQSHLHAHSSTHRWRDRVREQV